MLSRMIREIPQVGKVNLIRQKKKWYELYTQFYSNCVKVRRDTNSDFAYVTEDWEFFDKLFVAPKPQPNTDYIAVKKFYSKDKTVFTMHESWNNDKLEIANRKLTKELNVSLLAHFELAFNCKIIKLNKSVLLYFSNHNQCKGAWNTLKSL